MVRLKSRWILLSIKFQRDVLLSSASNPDAVINENDQVSVSSTSSSSKLFPSSVQLSHMIRDAIIQYFGDSAMGATLSGNIHVHFCDPQSKLSVIRVARDYCSMVCSTMTYITVWNQRRIVLSIHSIHGSGRTAKRKAIHILKNTIWKPRIMLLHQKLKQINHDIIITNNNNNTKHERNNGNAMQELLSSKTKYEKMLHRSCQTFNEVLNQILNIG